MNIEQLIAPDTCAVLCMEMQRGVVGDLAVISGLSQAVRDTGVIPHCVELFAVARKAGMPIIHCTAGFRTDRAGSYLNMPLVNRLLEKPDYLVAGTPATAVVAELRAADDFELARLHGMSPFTDTGLDSLLRSLNKRTLILTGVSVNLGIIGLAIEAVNRGYQVVIPKDAVAGYPREYCELVFEHSLSKISTLSDVKSIVGLLTPDR
jgi:nicotinamidase-related amidase